MASGRCSGGGGSFYSELMGCLGGGGDDEAAENAPAEVREVALEPVSPSRAGETYEQHLARARSPRRPPPRDAAGDDAVDEAPTGLRAKLKKAASFKKGDLAKYGVSAFFAYGFVSNVNSCLLLSFTWATFRRANPALSPLADAAVLANPLTWLPLKKKFLAYYMGYYLSIGSILRPFRFAIALGLAPTFEKTYVKISDRLKVPRAVSIFIVTILTNVVFTVGLLLVAVNLFCAALRVAPVPL